MNDIKFKKIHPLLKLFAFIVLMIISASIFTLIGSFVASQVYNLPIYDMQSLMKNTNALIIMQIFSSIGAFVLPAIIYIKLFEKKPLNFLKIDKKPDVKVVVFTIILFFLANFVLGLLVKVMYFIPFENFDNAFIQGLLQAEKDGENTLKQFLVFESPLKFLVLFFMMAIIPAVGEELTFRGVFMNLFEKASNNIIFSIFFSAFIFSIVHMQLHNFLAILFMGIMLGSIYYLTKNLWISIIAHLFNNGLIVVASYLKSLNIISFDLTKSDELPITNYLFGTLIFMFAFYLYSKYLLSKK